LWHWEAPHPAWKPGEDWDEMVSSYAIDDGRLLRLFDPLAVPGEIVGLACGRELPEDWLREGVTRKEIVGGLQPLLDLPVELVLATHGGPTNKAALERALA
jgi:hypothetical protein